METQTTVVQSKSTEEANVPELYFKSAAHEYIFALVYTDLKIRQKLLHITEDLYEDENKARKWRNGIVAIIHPDTCDIPNAGSAVIKLNELYARMVEKNE